jgi:hypothetical protein
MIKRTAAHFFSVLFHPLFISVYVMAFIIFVHPYAFSAFDHKQKVLRLVTVILCNTFLPLFAVFLLWRLQLIKSPMLRNEKERIIPYIIAMIFYFWSAYVFKHLPDTPALANHFLGGAFLAVVGAWICNIYFKVSMHAIALGGATMFFCLFGLNDEYGSAVLVAGALLATGLVCSSRLILSAHSSFEIWAGIFVGVFAQYAAWEWPWLIFF